MEVRAHLGRVRVSARKARLVVDAVRGRPVLEAQAMLRFIPNKTAFELEKLMKSLAANAENNYDLDPRRSRDQGDLRGRGPDDAAIPGQGAWSRGAHQQAHLQHHGRRRGSGRTR